MIFSLFKVLTIGEQLRRRQLKIIKIYSFIISEIRLIKV